MIFAQQHSSCQNNYTHAWPENQNMSYRNNNPEISSFASSNHMQGFRYNEESHNYAPQQFHSAPTHIPQYQEMCPMELNGPPFGQPTTPAPVVQSHVQVPTQDEFDDIDKLTLLSLEFTWSAEDDPIRKVIMEEMKKIKSGKELVEEVRKIEKNINAGSTISSLLELSVDGISLEVCEVPTPSHPAEQDSKSPEEEIPQTEEDDLEDEEQDDEELKFPSDQDEDKRATTLEEVKEAAVDELEEPEIHLPIVIQERDVAGISNPLSDMHPCNLFDTTLHCTIPSLKLDLKIYFLGHDHTYPISGITLICDDHSYFPRASPMLNETYHSHASLELNDKYHPHVSVDLADFDHPKHVLYSYAYVIGYSIDDLEGIIPTTCIFSFVECSFRFLLVHESLHAVGLLEPVITCCQVEIHLWHRA
ncbi:unnamed protein product [Triticum aestivum]|uniref:Uncharacterized protein n=1 Tax=Triticum aestivum TaxID=4565 RepID=A0A7H4LGI9_WHEAT|nr:unnamed protein product [Triticum aestivum]